MELNFLKIEIISPGKIKNDFISAGFQEYTKRLQKFVKITFKDIGSSHSVDPRICVEEESKKLLKYIGTRKFTLLDVNGIEMNTPEFSTFLKRELESEGEMFFVIGGIYGVSEEIKNLASSRLSLSRMTFTHSLTFLLLVEQIYRSMKIISGQPYDH
jgi:23S rRNA (pseudouridine1915-N3)-methyltransferase